ncbi:RbsD/FucU family protein [Glaciimonas sp. GG7]
MLKSISPLLTPDLLHALAAMGHGDEIAIVDANFPATSMARRLVIIPGIATPPVVQAVLSLFPIDDFVPEPGWTMEIVGNPLGTVPALDEIRNVVGQYDARPVASLSREAFYQRATAAFAIVQTGELRKYGNVILKKGVIATE